MNLHGWIPVRAHWPEGEKEPSVDWCLIGDDRFTEPFFENTLRRHMRHPFHQVFRRRTSVQVLGGWRRESPGAPLAGVIFHMSRCGSTALARMLGALEQNIVLSEAPPLETLLRGFDRPGIVEADWMEWVRGMVSALGQRRSHAELRTFLKLDSWNIAALPALERAFPGVPWIFLYRDPIEVLASHSRSPGGWTIPSLLPPAVLGLEQEAAALAWQDYRVRVVARVCELALQHRRCGRGLFVNYSQLPEAVWTVLGDHFGVPFSGADVCLLREASQQDSRTPEIAFRRAAQSPSDLASETRELASRWLTPLYREMEALNAVAVR